MGGPSWVRRSTLNVIMSNKNKKITAHTKQYAVEKIQNLERIYELQKVEIKLNASADGYRVKIMAWPKYKDIVVGASTERDWFTAINAAGDKVESQIRRHKDKIVDRRGRKVEPTPPSFPVSERDREEGDTYEDIIHDFTRGYADFEQLRFHMLFAREDEL